MVTFLYTQIMQVIMFIPSVFYRKEIPLYAIQFNIEITISILKWFFKRIVRCD